MEFADGKLGFDYDVSGNLTRVGDGQADVNYEHLGNERQLIRRLPNGIRSITQYSPLGQIESIHHEDAKGAVLAEFRYQYDAKDRVTVAEETTPSGTVKKTYAYDLMGRLVKFSASDGTAWSYEYDALGNRTAETDAAGKRTDYHYDSSGRLLRAGAVEYTYDESGNLSAKKENGTKTGYRFDTAGRLAEVEGAAGVIRYGYDGEGKRIRRESPQGVTQYLTHRLSPLSQVVAEYDGSGKLKRRYLPGLTKVAQRDTSGMATYLLEDRLGSVRCVVDFSGKVVTRYDYSPFGLPKLTEGSEKTDLLYTGEPLDRETGLIYLRTRYYDPATGRFVSQDPVAGNVLETQSLNRYAYANNDPVNFKDPAGLYPCPSQGNCQDYQPSPIWWKNMPHETYQAFRTGEIYQDKTRWEKGGRSAIPGHYFVIKII